MKKNFIKHSSVVVAALLAAASVGAATGTVKAADKAPLVTVSGNNTINNNHQYSLVNANTKTDGKQSAASQDPKGQSTTAQQPTQPTQSTSAQPTTPANPTAPVQPTTPAQPTTPNQGTTTNNGQTTNGSTTTTGTTTTTNGTQNTTTNSNTTANTNNNSSANNTSTSTSQQPADNNSNSTSSTTSTSTTSAAKPVVRIAQRSYVYTKSGKIARKNGKRVVLKKSSTRSLSNAKLVTIKGQKYYQIGKNQYVKASNVIAPIKKANVRAVVKGRKNARVRAYTSTGKRTRSYLSGRKSYKFTARRSINGRTYYKVSGRNLWIPASKLNIR